MGSTDYRASELCALDQPDILATQTLRLTDMHQHLIPWLPRMAMFSTPILVLRQRPAIIMDASSAYISR